ncbi:MAG: hypothetical protein AB8U44_03475 [Aaplasma endosymbiont of Hyalomma asiaticum]
MLKYYFIQVLSVVILITMVFMLRYAYSISSGYSEYAAVLEKDVHKMKSYIRSTRSQEIKLNNSFPVWQELYNTRVYTDSDQDSEESLDSMIRKLCKLHKVTAEEIVISEPLDVSSRYNKRYIKVESSKVNIKFSALTDKHAVLFMRAVKYDIPGFVAMKLFEVTKNGEVTREVIEANRSGIVYSTVEGKMAFDLYRIKGHHI